MESYTRHVSIPLVFPEGGLTEVPGAVRVDVMRRIRVVSNDELGMLADAGNRMIRGPAERERVRESFGRYVDREVSSELMKRPEASRLGGEKREVVILMADIRGFTAISETLSPEATIRVLNQYFALMIGVIQKHRGIIVDFYGDGVLVFFEPQNGGIRPAAERAIR